MNIIIASSNSISCIYNVFIASTYDDREFKNILINHDVADFFSKDIEQLTTLQQISKTTLILNKKRIIFLKFDINEILFIDIVNLNFFVNVIIFHIVFVQISFLLCLIDMNRLRFYFNNLINMFIKERTINEVLFRKKLYAIHSNQIKKFQIQILMSSKSLIRNGEMMFDLHINLKAFQLTDDLQINLKIEHFRMIDNLHINMKYEHHSIIRLYDHAFFLWNISAQSLIAKSFDRNSYFFIEIELRRLHRRFDHFSIRRLQAILDWSDHEINSRAIEYFIKYCHHCQIHEKSSNRFDFILKNDLEFNFNVIVNIVYLKIKFNVNKSILHVMNETIRFQVDRWLKNITARHVWDSLHVCWIDTYLESLDLITSNANKQFIVRKFKQYAANMSIKVNIVLCWDSSLNRKDRTISRIFSSSICNNRCDNVWNWFEFDFANDFQDIKWLDKFRRFDFHIIRLRCVFLHDRNECFIIDDHSTIYCDAQSNERSSKTDHYSSIKWCIKHSKRFIFDSDS
jgi:hypothetical protein